MAGYIFAAIGVLYAVLMAFVIVALWSADDAAQQNTYREANDLAAVYWLSRQMPLAQGRPLERLTLAYARTVETQEWPLMARHQNSPEATQLVYQMRDEAFGMNPATLRDQVIFHEVTDSTIRSPGRAGSVPRRSRSSWRGCRRPAEHAIRRRPPERYG